MKWLVLVVFLVGCTAIHIRGDNNSITIKDTIESDAEVEPKKSK